MIVTKENFAEAKRQFAAILPKASFIAFDEEMSGIFISDDRDYDGVDTVEGELEFLIYLIQYCHGLEYVPIKYQSNLSFLIHHNHCHFRTVCT